jgi:hypothetical protein
MPELSSLPLLVALAFARDGHALGLGDLLVESALGQVFNARVALYTAPGETVSLDCLRLEPIHNTGLPGLNRARLSLEGTAAVPVLRIRSEQPIRDPVLQIQLVAHCQGLLQRQYVSLLDLPAQADTAPLALAMAPKPDINETAQAPSHTQTPPASRAAPRVRPPAAAQVIKADTQPAPANPARLQLSASRVVPPAHLKLTRDLLQFDPPRQTAALMTAQLADETTALQHRADHLRRQLATPPSTATAAPAAAPPSAATLSSLLPLTGGLAATVLLAIGALWMRRQASAGQAAQGLYPEPYPDNPLPAPASSAVLDDGDLPPGLSATELKDNIIDEAEVFVAHGHTHLAMNLLEEHLQNTPRDSPVPWLLLLDLQKRTGQRARFEATRTACKQNFNIRLGTYEDIEHDDEGSLENYPHVIEELVRLWAVPAADHYLDELLLDNRGGTRLGFDLPAVREIMMLRQIRKAA